MSDPVISEIKYYGVGTVDVLEVRIPDDYPDPQNLVLVIYDRSHNGSQGASPAASDIYNVTTDGTLYTEDANGDGVDDDGFLHYTLGTSENGTTIYLHKEDAVGLYNAATLETYGLYSWHGTSYTVSEGSNDPFAGEEATLLDSTGQVSGQTSLALQPDGTYALATTPTPGSSYICFTAGTRILTAYGEVPVEDLCVGDEVVTKDRGLQKVKWIGSRILGASEMSETKNQPIVIKAHAFGPNVPSQDTHLSQNHAVLCDHWKASLYFGDQEVLTPAKSFLCADYAFRKAIPSVTYFHVLLDSHSLMQANGMWSESLFLGSECMEMLSPQNRAEIFTVLPQLGGAIESYGQTVRHQLKPREAELLM